MKMEYKNNLQDKTEEGPVFMDKYRLSFNILEQEGILILQYNELVRSKTAGYYDNNTIKKSLAFLDCWATLKGLYDFLEFGKLPYIKEKDKLANLKEIMEKYEVRGNITYEDLRQAYTLIREFIALSGYHEDTFKDKGGTLDNEED